MGSGQSLLFIGAVLMIAVLLRCAIRFWLTAKRNNARSAAPRSTRSPERRPSEVRRTTVYTITADPRGNDAANDFTDFFWDGLPHASSSQNEAKDDKDLPTYEQVMQLEMTRRAVGSTTVTPGNNNTATSSVVVPVIPVVAASTV